MIKAFRVRPHTTADLFFTEEIDATKASKGRGEWGSDASVDEITIHETYEGYADARVKALRENALRKLTAEEIRALGIK